MYTYDSKGSHAILVVFSPEGSDYVVQIRTYNYHAAAEPIEEYISPATLSAPSDVKPLDCLLERIIEARHHSQRMNSW